MSRTVRKCKRVDCDRPAKRGWTHCLRHYTSGRRLRKGEDTGRKKPPEQGGVR